MKNELGVIVSVIILAVLSIVFGVLAYLNYSTIDPGDDTKKKMDNQIAEERRKIDELKRGPDGITGIEGYTREKEKISEQIIQLQQQAEYYRSQRDAYVKAYEARLKNKEEGARFDQQAKDMAAKVAEGKKKVSDRIQAAITAERTEMEQKVQVLSDRKAKAQADVLQRKEEFDKSAKKFTADMNYVKSQLGDAKQVLADLTTREEIRADISSKPDGTVVLADNVHDLVSINVGTGMGVKNGFRFEVFSLLPGKKHVSKAFVEVRKAGGTQSECLVIRRPVVLPADEGGNYIAEGPEYVYNPYNPVGKKPGATEPMTGARVVMSGQKATNPILEGDYIQNPFFEAGRQLVFYIAGSKEMVGERQKSAIRYRWAEIKDAAERHGAKVVDTISTDVNYVIAQKNPQDDPEYKKAVDLGIPVIFEWELFRFLDNN